MIPIGENIGKLRARKYMTQRQLAQKIGVSSSMVALYETGNRYPSLNVLIELSRVLGVSTDYLLGVSNFKGECLDVSGLTPEQISSVQMIIDNYRKL